MADVNDIIAYGFGSWSDVNSVPTLGFAIGAAPVMGTGAATLTITSSKPTITFTGGELVGCITRLSAKACEESTYAVAGSIVDEDDVALIPDTLTWSLYRLDGTVVNARSAIVLTPAATFTITLSGDDLSLFTEDSGVRRLTVEGTFTSSLGSGLPLKAESEFVVGDLVGVS
jgi:hypothetical protein